MRILILEVTESDNVILEDVFELLSDRTGIRVVDLSHEAKSRINLEQQVLTFSDFEIRVREQAIYKNGVFIPMSHYEFFALCYLAKHPGWVFSKQQIYEAVWDNPDGDGNAAVTNIISQIRKKLNPGNPMHGYIRTVVNSGYKFVEDDST